MNILQTLLSFPVNITRAAYRIAIGAHVVVVGAVIGQVAQVVSHNQPLLNVAFGNQKGALLAIGATAIAAAATTLAAHGDPLGAPALPSQALNIVSDSLAPMNITQTSGNASVPNAGMPTQASSIPGVRTEI